MSLTDSARRLVPPVPPKRLRYQPPLDGLRALAVLAVMLAHGGAAWLRGGALGVDVFFVLSGYLITALLMAEWHDRGSIDMWDFWARRARRLLPALVLVLVAVGAYAVFLAPPRLRQQVWWEGFAALFSSANWAMVIDEQSYFDLFTGLSPLRHLWSLGVEEQWYLILPLVLAGGLRLVGGRTRRLIPAAVALALASAAVMAMVEKPLEDPSRAYYGTDARVQALLIGAVVALALRPAELVPVWRRRLSLGAYVGAGLLAAMLLYARPLDHWMYQGGYTLVALASAALIAGAVDEEPNVVRRVLSAGPLPAIGRISYGLYLWHWPLYLTLTPGRTHLEGLSLLALRMAATFGAATLSYRLIERPIRQGGLRQWKRAAPALTTASAGVVAAVVMVAGLAERPTPALAHIPTQVSLPAAADRSADEAGLLLVGDSVAWSLGSHLEPDWVSPKVVTATRAQPGCSLAGGRPVVSGRLLGFDPPCERWTVQLRDAVETFEPDVVMVMFGALEVFDRRVGGRLLEVGTDAYERHLSEELDKVLHVLTSEGSPVALVTVPCFEQPRLDLGEVVSEHDDQQRLASVNTVLGQVASRHLGTVSVIDVGQLLCPGGEPREELNGAKLRDDGVHFNRSGAELTWRWLAPELLELARAHRPTASW